MLTKDIVLIFFREQDWGFLTEFDSKVSSYLEYSVHFPCTILCYQFSRLCIEEKMSSRFVSYTNISKKTAFCLNERRKLHTILVNLKHVAMSCIQNLLPQSLTSSVRRCIFLHLSDMPIANCKFDFVELISFS